MAIGITKYPETSYELPLATKDATEVIAQFSRGGKALFREVRPYFLPDDKASREGITQAFEQLASDSSPDDVVVVYLAGHGRTLGQQYFFAPYDVGFGTTADEATAYRTRGISDAQLTEFLRRIRAQKLAVILDTCESSTALGTITKTLVARGDQAETRALRTLARSSGIHLIAASKDKELAYESTEVGHGLSYPHFSTACATPLCLVRVTYR
jgi:uncharacterized caspase-like protein